MQQLWPTGQGGGDPGQLGAQTAEETAASAHLSETLPGGLESQLSHLLDYGSHAPQGRAVRVETTLGEPASSQPGSRPQTRQQPRLRG